ncbi:DNA mismatch repair protein MSH3 [Iris pallida]|uniref:DNA mismatch repair protein MSH3 n=1 Tax=Iris pallida TaxID=29817 RepID=A0AAX6GYF3_IRIPA|nr:DNA mismatch repair protein MSH3 [Iris pallida]
MGKPKQQVISRFFSPKPLQNPNPNPNPPPSPRVSATVSFSPAKRALAKSLNPSPSPNKKPKTLTLPQPNPSLHEKFLSKLLDAPPTTTTSLPQKNPNHTPLELQVLDLKSRHPDVLLMVEVGYRYRFFGEDAEVASKVLGIYSHMDRNFLTASVPTFRLQFHVRRLVSAGYKVGVVKQTESAAIKAHGSNRVGPFNRGLSAVYTKSTIEAAEDMGEGEREGGSNYLLCVVEREEVGTEGFEVRIGVVAVEVSTGEVVHGEFNDDAMRFGLEALVLSLGPAEILLGEPLSVATEKLLLAHAGPSSNVRVERSSRNCFNDGGAIGEVVSLYEKLEEDTSTLGHGRQPAVRGEGNQHLGIEDVIAMPELIVQALALTIRYLKVFGLERIICLGASFRPFSSTYEMKLSTNTLHQLEIVKNNSDGRAEGSLLQAINHTSTAFGSRLLKHWVTHPLCDRNLIIARLDAVSEIAESMCSASQNPVGLDDNFCHSFILPEISNILSQVLTTLGKSPDIQRGITRIFHQTATATEFIGVIHAILICGKQLGKLHVEDDSKNGASEGYAVKSALLRRLILTASSSTIISHAAKLLSSLNKDAADKGDMLNLFIASTDQFPEVFSRRIAVQMANENLDRLIVQYQKQLRMSSLEFMSVSGTTHLIELPLDARVPSNWVKVNSTKKTNRYHTPEILAALDKLALYREELAVTCKTTWRNFLMEFGRYYSQFQAAVQALAALDCLHSFASLSKYQNYVRPDFVDDGEPVQINLQSGRHPVLESVIGDNFVPNDTNLHVDAEYCQIVTGPNMGGKSCYIRQVALIAILAQVGSFVPASSAKLHVLDGIYTRMGASDSIQLGNSTFLEELSEASNILHSCSSRSLVIIDELGRGTSTHDGVAIAYATLHYLLEQKKCLVLFVSHYPKILEIQNEFEGSVGTYHVSYLTSEKQLEVSESQIEAAGANLNIGDITFLYKVVRGASDKSFGLNVARLAQLPSSCIARAAFMSVKLEAEVSARAGAQVHKLITGIPTQPNFLEESSKDPVSSSTETQKFEELGKVCQQVLSCIGPASNDCEPNHILSSLKDARELALKALKSYHSD